MKRFLAQRIDLIVVAVGLSFLILLSVKTLHNLANLSATEAPQELRLDGTDLVALYTLNAGMNKPAVLSRRGDVLVEFSGWNSYVTVDGVTADLWSHAFNIELDRARNRAFLTWSSVPPRQDDPRPHRLRRYQIEQVVSLSGDRAVVEYYIIPNEPIKDVQLTVGLYNWYYQDLKRSENQYAFASTDLTRTQTEQRMQARRFTPALVSSVTRPIASQSLTNEFGVYAIELSYVARSPRIYERTLLAQVEVTLRRGR